VLNALPAIAAGRRHGIPVVYEVRACWEDAAVDHGSTTEDSLRYRVTRALETHALRRADAVTVICDGLRREFESRGIPADKITVIPNAVEVNNFRFGAHPDAELRRALGLEGAVVLGFLGSFYAYEGLDLLLEALPRLLPTRPQLRVLLVGGGPQEAALKAQAQRLGIADKVIFTGRVPHAEVQRYYDLVDLLAYPRHPMRLTELVTPLKPLEAMAQGRLVVASDVGGHRELIRHGTTGLLFKAGNAESLAATVTEALSMPGCAEIRTRARQFVENERTWSQSVRNYERIYTRLTARRNAKITVLARHGED
jgi:PEP-CTERM/exosortase A-associated glycosyltransferase